MNSIANYIIEFIKKFIPIKDYNKVILGQLSWFLIPTFFIIWYLFPSSNNIFAIGMISITVIGIIETLFYIPLTTLTKIYSTIFHLLLIIPIFYNKLFNFSKKIKNKSCLVKSNNKKKHKNVRFSNNNKNYYRNDIRYLLSFNIENLITLIISIFIILYLPYWPYYMNRKEMLIILILVYLSCWIYSNI